MHRNIIGILIFLVCTLVALPAQDTSHLAVSSKIYVIETSDGGKIIGTILSDDGEEIVVKTQSMGAVTIQRTAIRSIKESDGATLPVDATWYDNPNASRYLVGPSAIPQHKGTGYYQNAYLFLSAANYGITDHFGISAGTELISVMQGRAPEGFCISPRVGYNLSPKFYVGGALLYTFLGGYSYYGPDHNIITTGLLTYGTRDNNLTAGLAWTFKNETYYSGNGNYDRKTIAAGYPSFSLSGMWRVARWMSLVTENWFYVPAYSNRGNGYYGEFAYSVGARAMAKKFSFDFGIVNNPDWYSWWRWGIPYLGFTINFETKQSRINKQ